MMSVTAALQELDQRLQALYDALMALRTTITEDRPLPDDHVLVGRMSDGVDDVLGDINEMLASVRRRQPTDCQPLASETACRVLTTCQSSYNRALRRFWLELAAHGQMSDLVRLGRERGGEWRPWSASVLVGMECCQQPLFEVNDALFHGWREIVDRH